MDRRYTRQIKFISEDYELVIPDKSKPWECYTKRVNTIWTEIERDELTILGYNGKEYKRFLLKNIREL